MRLIEMLKSFNYTAALWEIYVGMLSTPGISESMENACYMVTTPRIHILKLKMHFFCFDRYRIHIIEVLIISTMKFGS